MSAMTGTSTQRLSLIPLASRVLAELLRRIEPGAGGDLGLRPARGAALPADARADAAARPADRGLPAHGGGLGAQPRLRRRRCYAWLRPFYADRPAAEQRLILAACLLHDVQLAGASRLSRRALLRVGDARQHRRDRPCRAGVPRAGAAQPLQGGWRRPRRSRRYGGAAGAGAGGGGGGARPGDAARLDAVGLGDRACSSTPALAREGGRLVLTLRGPAREFAGEAVERRLQTLAARLDCPGEIVLAELDGRRQ